MTAATTLTPEEEEENDEEEEEEEEGDQPEGLLFELILFSYYNNIKT